MLGIIKININGYVHLLLDCGGGVGCYEALHSYSTLCCLDPASCLSLTGCCVAAGVRGNASLAGRLLTSLDRQSHAAGARPELNS